MGAYPDVANCINESPGYFGTPLKVACSGGFTDIVRFLLKHPAVEILSQSKDYKSSDDPLTAAISCGNEAIVKLLLESPKVDCRTVIHKYSYSPLYVACQKEDNIKIVKLLSQFSPRFRQINDPMSILSAAVKS